MFASIDWATAWLIFVSVRASIYASSLSICFFYAAVDSFLVEIVFGVRGISSILGGPIFSIILSTISATDSVGFVLGAFTKIGCMYNGIFLRYNSFQILCQTILQLQAV